MKVIRGLKDDYKRMCSCSTCESEAIDKGCINYEVVRSAIILIACIVVCSIMLVFGCNVASAEESIDGYTVSQYVEAIYQAEGGAKAQYPYGIRSVHCGTIQECKKIARNTVKNNIRRYENYGRNQFASYLEFLQSRYCPTKGVLTAREKEVNQYWIKNVRYFLSKEQ